jgi:hypothetical protein
MAWARALRVSTVFILRINAFHIPLSIHSSTQTADKHAFLNTGATENFISKKTLKKLGIGTQKLPQTWKVRNANGTPNRIGEISKYMDLLVTIGAQKSTQRFYIIDLGSNSMILGYPWFARFEPKIRWATQNWLGPPVKIFTAPPVTTTKQDHEPGGKPHWKASAAPAILEEGDEVFVGLTRGSASTRKVTTAQRLAEEAYKKSTPITIPPEYQR